MGPAHQAQEGGGVGQARSADGAIQGEAGAGVAWGGVLVHTVCTLFTAGELRLGLGSHPGQGVRETKATALPWSQPLHLGWRAVWLPPFGLHPIPPSPLQPSPHHPSEVNSLPPDLCPLQLPSTELLPAQNLLGPPESLAALPWVFRDLTGPSGPWALPC